MRKHSETLSAYSSSEEAISFSRGNLFFFITIFSQIKSKNKIGLNNKTLQSQLKQVNLFNQNSTKTRNYKFDSLNKKNDFHYKNLSSQRGEGDERVAAL